MASGRQSDGGARHRAVGAERHRAVGRRALSLGRGDRHARGRAFRPPRGADREDVGCGRRRARQPALGRGRQAVHDRRQLRAAGGVCDTAVLDRLVGGRDRPRSAASDARRGCRPERGAPRREHGVAGGERALDRHVLRRSDRISAEALNTRRRHMAAQLEHKGIEIDRRVYALYDEYCHGRIDRREFLARASALVIGGVSALAMAQSLFPRYAEAQTISFTDDRIKAKYVEYPSPGGTSGQMRGYLVQPKGDGPFAAVLVIHENRGLNPYVEDVARRAAVAGFVALAPDGLAPVGGYPGNDDDGRTLQSSLDQAKLRRDMVNSALFLKKHALSSGKLGATGFCWGGGMVNNLAVAIGADLNAGVPFYGAAPAAADVAKIKAALLIQYAGMDERIDGMWPEYEAALKANKVSYQMYTYEGTNHGFHNNSTPRYSEAAANLAWERTIAFFKQHLA